MDESFSFFQKSGASFLTIEEGRRLKKLNYELTFIIGVNIFQISHGKSRAAHFIWGI